MAGTQGFDRLGPDGVEETAAALSLPVRPEPVEGPAARAQGARPRRTTGDDTPPLADQGGRLASAWRVLATVLDPEVPAVSVVDLGIVRDVIDLGDALEVVLTPTYSGCPATEAIEHDVLAALDAAGLGPARATLRRAPAWTSDWITPAGRERLRAYGIAPPGPSTDRPADAGAAVPIRIVRARPPAALACPRCGSLVTERLSAFGSTACKALWRCRACGEPFEHFKPI